MDYEYEVSGSFQIAKIFIYFLDLIRIRILITTHFIYSLILVRYNVHVILGANKRII